MRYFEDFTPQVTEKYGAYTLSKESLIGFAKQYDMQPMHIDEGAAKHSFLGELIASGWQTASILMRLMYDGYIHNTASYGAPGIEELKWLKPVKPQDVLRVEMTVLEKNQLKSRPEMGRVKMHYAMFNQAGEQVLDVVNWGFVGLKGSKPPQALPSHEGRALAPVRLANFTPRSMLFDDLVIGQENVLGSQFFSREEVIAFAKTYDPQPFHLSDEGAKQSYFGRLSASGWQTGSMFMKTMVQWRMKMVEAQQKAGLPQPKMGPAAGFKNLKWIRPVYAGDTITYSNMLNDKRLSASREGWGIIGFTNNGYNQYGDHVFEFTGTAFTSLK